jgi:hypothetical protein
MGERSEAGWLVNGRSASGVRMSRGGVKSFLAAPRISCGGRGMPEEGKLGLASGLRSIQIFLPAFVERTIIASSCTASEAAHQTCEADPRRTA